MECANPRCSRTAQADSDYCWTCRRPRVPLHRQSRMPRQNKERAAKMRKKRHGPQSELCKTLPCGACGAHPTRTSPTHAHHWPTVARGGTDEDTGPLCGSCHTMGGSPRAFHSTALADWEAFHQRTMVSIVQATRDRLAATEDPGCPWSGLPY